MQRVRQCLICAITGGATGIATTDTTTVRDRKEAACAPHGIVEGRQELEQQQVGVERASNDGSGAANA
jgi:hypothetical protein